MAAEGVRDTGDWAAVYNLRVADHHTYFVGADEWEFAVWAHNACVRLAGDKKYAEGYNRIFGGKPYSNINERPKYGKGQVEQVWNNARQANGKVYDPNTGVELHWNRGIPRTGQWDMGHIKGRKYSDLHKDYMSGRISREEFLREYRNPRNYRPEHPLENQGHGHE